MAMYTITFLEGCVTVIIMKTLHFLCLEIQHGMAILLRFTRAAVSKTFHSQALLIMSYIKRYLFPNLTFLVKIKQHFVFQLWKKQVEERRIKVGFGNEDALCRSKWSVNVNQ